MNRRVVGENAIFILGFREFRIFGIHQNSQSKNPFLILLPPLHGPFKGWARWESYNYYYYSRIRMRTRRVSFLVHILPFTKFFFFLQHSKHAQAASMLHPSILLTRVTSNHDYFMRWTTVPGTVLEHG